MRCKPLLCYRFLSTPSARRATAYRDMRYLEKPKFLSTPSARRATGQWRVLRHVARISIHALREEGDNGKLLDGAGVFVFLSTPSARRATTHFGRWMPCLSHFYPRPPRGGRRGQLRRPAPTDRISIHALREEGDPPSVPHFGIEWYISIHALREEGDLFAADTLNYFYISIHALREEGDSPRRK